MPISAAGIPTLTFVTGNEGKLREVRGTLDGYADVNAVKMDLPELQFSSVAEVSRNKALAAYDLLKAPVLVEDTGLSFEALGGMPGPYIRWFLGSVGVEGLAQMLNSFTSRRAEVNCVFSYCFSPQDVLQFPGVSKGTIATTPRGDGGFGFDSIFIPDDGDGASFAEMSEGMKNTISHRAKALAALRQHFEKKG
uniref:XTP/dITP diphosphatase n=1 Tax=Trypanosoma congolense (strain IL3000) TaxID=1068625 RepID=G0UXE4_TRYCI|nr:unnamed protein product [Trypanosoma congolense IL3000]